MKKPATKSTNGKSPPARQLAVAIFFALATVLIGSRINRPMPLEFFDGRAWVGDEVLPEVKIDTHSLRSAIGSIQNVAKGRIVIEGNLWYKRPSGYHEIDWPIFPLRNVRLATAMVIAMEQFPVNFNEQNRGDGNEYGVSLGSPGPVYTRCYDISDLVEIARKAYQPPRPVVKTNLCFFEAPNDSINHSIELIFTESVPPFIWPPPGWSVRAWGNQLIVNAGLEGHRSVEEMLLLLRRECASAEPGRSLRP